ncbi:hypothetical protein NPIL_692751 [Nephila pilipes]|uniref:Uncharacterized protein n=1 Tax=Nephila pilipes TaxID=299642 RepID=A0A8X6UEJ4_NEPPI|nr:hypothetical protein NPIL_692751 [Nephila pilipes]
MVATVMLVYGTPQQNVVTASRLPITGWPRGTALPRHNALGCRRYPVERGYRRHIASVRQRRAEPTMIMSPSNATNGTNAAVAVVRAASRAAVCRRFNLRKPRHERRHHNHAKRQRRCYNAPRSYNTCRREKLPARRDYAKIWYTR